MEDLSDEKGCSSQSVRHRDQVRLWRSLRDEEYPKRNPCGYLLQLSPLLYGQTKILRYGGKDRAVQEEIWRKGKQEGIILARAICSPLCPLATGGQLSSPPIPNLLLSFGIH